MHREFFEIQDFPLTSRQHESFFQFLSKVILKTGAQQFSILGKLVGNVRFPCGFPYVYIGKPGFPCGFPRVSLFETQDFHVVSPIFHMGKPLVDPSFHAIEACKPERRVFPLEGNFMEKGSFLDGNPMEICCKLVVTMCSFMFPLKGNRFFHPVFD